MKVVPLSSSNGRFGVVPPRTASNAAAYLLHPALTASGGFWLVGRWRISAKTIAVTAGDGSIGSSRWTGSVQRNAAFGGKPMRCEFRIAESVSGLEARERES